MHDFTEGHGPGDVLGGAQENGNDRRKPATALGDEGRADVLHHQLVPALADRRERSVKAGALLIAPAQHRDALAVFPEAREHVPVVRLRLILVLGDRDEGAGNHHHRSAGQNRIEESGDHQKARDAEHRAAEWDCQLAADEPEHADESDRRDDRREDADANSNRLGTVVHSHRKRPPALCT